MNIDHDTSDFLMYYMNHVGVMNSSYRNNNRVDGRTRTAESITIFVVVVGNLNVARVRIYMSKQPVVHTELTVDHTMANVNSAYMQWMYR